MIKNRYLLSSTLAFSIAILTGCGGGGSTTDTTVANTSSQPHQLSARDLQNVDILATANQIPSLTITTNPVAKTLTITHFGSNDHDKTHYQFFLNVDNNPDTGYHFDNAVWDNAGTDYIVENGLLFKSTANDSSWSWDYDVGAASYSERDNSVSVTIEQSLLEGLGPIIRAGFITRNFDWSVSNFYPQSSLMAEYKLDIQPPEDTIPPSLIMNGSSFIEIRKGDNFTDPGVTATDNVDGDITDKIIVESNLDTNTLGTYKITYRVSDAVGNTDQISRTIKVITNTPANIIIDGNKSDWSDKSAVSSGQGVLKAFDTTEKLFLMFDASNTDATLANTQFFLETDNNSATGFQFNGSIWYTGSADYMIENNHLDKAQGNSSAWAWYYDTSPIEVAKNDKVIEIAIPKAALTNIEDTIRVGFVNRDEQWTIDPHTISTGMTDYQSENNSVARNLTLLPNFCGNVWETNGTPESTKISPFNSEASNNDLVLTHNDEWYGVEEHLNAGTGENEIHIVRYNGIRKTQFLPLHLVRDEPLGNDKITNMKFLGDTLYFVFGNELWSTDGTRPGSHIVKKFTNSSIKSLHPVGSYLAVNIRPDGNDADAKTTWIVTPDNNSNSESIFLARGGSPLNILFTNIQSRSVYMSWNGTYYKYSDSQGLETLDFIPLAGYGDDLYIGNYNWDSSEYTISLLKQDSAIPTTLKTFSLGFPTNIRRIEDEDHMYLSFENNGSRDQYIWLLNFKDNTFKRVDREHVPFPSSSSPQGMSIYRVAGNDFSIWVGGRYQGTTLYRLNGVGDDNALNRTRIASLSKTSPGTPDALKSREYFYWNGSLYFTYIKEDIETTKFMGVINDSSGEIKELGSCQ